MEKIALVIGGKLISSKNNYENENVYIYDMVTFDEAVNIAIDLEKNKKVDIIISPAGTALKISKYITLPIVQTDISDFDILETLIYAESDSKILDKKIALIMHDSRKISLERLQPFLKNKLFFYSYQDQDELKNLVYKLSEEGIDIIVGGPTTIKMALNTNLKGYILRLTDESINLSINKAKESLAVSNRFKLQNLRFMTALSLFTDAVLIINNRGIITECNEKALNIFGLIENEVLGQKIEDITKDTTMKNVYKLGFKQTDKLVVYRELNLFTNMLPIVVDGLINGAIITMQEVNKIENLGRKFKEYQSKGFVAKYYFSDIKGISKSMTDTIKIADAYSKVDSDILLYGETGTGKELFAQSIHNSSNRKKGPFVAINCASITENLLESELMGYEEGAFTGAKKGGKIGLFELANMGTIFLDEINQLSLSLQGRILRVLQERQVRRLGCDKITSINVRVIAATNDNLSDLVDEGKFRKDLYYRISVLVLNIPPLRLRKGDISIIIQYYFNLFTNLYGNAAPFDEECLKMLENYQWNGNIREVINFVERYVVMNKTLTVSPIDYLDNYFKNESKNIDAHKLDVDKAIINLSTLKNMENQAIEAVLERYNNNKKLTALFLEISRTTLWKKLNDK